MNEFCSVCDIEILPHEFIDECEGYPAHTSCRDGVPISKRIKEDFFLDELDDDPNSGILPGMSLDEG
jgi:hypothetical protein